MFTGYDIPLVTNAPILDVFRQERPLSFPMDQELFHTLIALLNDFVLRTCGQVRSEVNFGKACDFSVDIKSKMK